MQSTIRAQKTTKDASKEILILREYIKHSGLESSLAELVKIRTSQINGCNHCVEKHKKEARAAGENSQRLWGVTAWTEFPFYNKREQAALAWTEVLARVPEAEVNDDLQQVVSEYFEEKDLDTLTTIITTINSWK